MADRLFERVAFVGAGLIAASLSRALRAAGAVKETVAYDRNPAAAERGVAIGAFDRAEAQADAAMANADVIVVATPVGAVRDVFTKINAAAPHGVLIIDVGSVKGAVADAASDLREDVMFVPCHPVAGTEQSGPDAGFAELFQERWCILTPLAREDAAYRAAVDQASALWERVGARVEIMEADHHDLALAVTSHLPHLIAFTLVGAADDVESVAQAEVVKYSAGGFRDFTRIAASDPVMWRDVFLNNKDAILEALGRFSEELAMMQRAIRWGDGAALEEAFARGRSLRRAIVEAGQETSEPNFGRDKD